MFTPTEAAGVAVVYSLLVTMFIHREVDLAGLWRIHVASAYLISQILLIVTSAGIYSWLLTTSGIPQQIVFSPGIETYIYFRDKSFGFLFSRRTERVESLTVRFDWSGILKEYEYRYSGN